MTRYQPELHFARTFVTKAGRQLQRSAEAWSVDVKSDGTLVTSADQEINQTFIDEVVRSFPSDSVLGEEANHPVLGSDRTWVIDPIDGTAQFVLGIPVFMISVALVVDGRPVVGVASNPSTGDQYWAALGGGAYRNTTAIQVSRRDGVTEPLIIAGAGATPTPSGLDADTLLRMVVSPEFGTSSYRFPWPTVFSVCKVAEGTWDADLYDGRAAHDVAASCLLVREAGGTVTDRDGGDQRYDQAVNGCITSNGSQHSELVRRWAQASAITE